MKKHIWLLVLLLLSSTNIIAQTLSNENFIYTATPQKAVQAANYNLLTPSELNQSVTYLDGLGRPIQSIAIGQGGNGSDIVTHIEYDVFGRQVKDYLPYALTNSNGALKTNALIGTNNFYNTTKYENTVNPYSQKLFETSPLSRILEQAAPGNDWSMNNPTKHTIRLDYQKNSSNEVKLYNVALSFANNTYTPTLSLSLVNNGFYAINQLYKTVTKDENWVSGKNNTVEEFKDKDGRVVLKRTYSNYENPTILEVAHDTYYIYDLYGNLTYVLPPKAEGATDSVTLDNLCFQYKYDNHNRLVEKKIPGKQWEFIVYDKLDRPVATGPAFSPFSDHSSPGNIGWLITKYDAFGRVAYTGWMASTTVTSAGRKTMQDAQNLATTLYESKQTTGTIDGISAYYSNSIAPTTFKLLTVNYYDNYTFPNVPTIPTSVETQTALSTTQVKSLPTGSWMRIATTSTAVLGETSSIFYDAKARPIRSYKKNHLNGYTYTDLKLNFVGATESSKTYHKRLATDSELKTTEIFIYSPQGRLITHTHQIGTGSIELLVENTYDDLGQLIAEKVGNTATAPTQKIDYSYNIRGWMTAINNTAALQQGTDPKDLFAFKINYNTTTTGISGVSALYNGNISETFWSSSSATTVRAYGYQYDNLNRLKNATYQKSGTTTNAYNENLTYDRNGNIKTLLRNGNNDVTTTAIDNLTYVYGTGNTNNQLLKVSDSSSKTTGFIDGANSTDDYSYDANGNLLKDLNKGIGTASTDGIIYNHLNLPVKIIFATGSNTGNIVYIYNAIGQKVQQIVNKLTPTVTTTTTDYLDGYQYKNNTLEFFPMEEGYVENNAGIYKYVFQYKDHQGNIRLTYDKTLQIKEENNYYPFGLKQVGYNSVINSTNQALKYKFNGKEFQEEMGLNMTAMDYRQYDNALGRFNSIDALTETSYSVSPFVFSYNNPIFWCDPTGLLSQAFMNSLWKNSPEKYVTTWYNDGGGTFSKEDGSGMVDQETGEFTGFDSLRAVTVKGKKTSDGGSYIEGNIGGLAQSKAYSFGKYYESWRSNFRTKQADDVQDWIAGLGTADPSGIFDGINALGYLARGQKANAAIAAISMLPYIGDAAKGSKLAMKTAKYEKLADGFGTRAFIREFNNTTPINTRILFNDITQGGTKKIIKTPKGTIINATMSNGSIIQLRNFSTKSGDLNHSTLEFIGTQNKWKFNY